MLAPNTVPNVRNYHSSVLPSLRQLSPLRLARRQQPQRGQAHRRGPHRFYTIRAGPRPAQPAELHRRCCREKRASTRHKAARVPATGHAPQLDQSSSVLPVPHAQQTAGPPSPAVAQPATTPWTARAPQTPARHRQPPRARGATQRIPRPSLSRATGRVTVTGHSRPLPEVLDPTLLQPIVGAEYSAGHAPRSALTLARRCIGHCSADIRMPRVGRVGR